jgi:hypothetical protein
VGKQAGRSPADDRIHAATFEDLVLAGRIAAKITLGANYLAFGQSPTSAPLAEQLRTRLRGETDMPPVRFAGEALLRLDDAAQDFPQS